MSQNTANTQMLTGRIVPQFIRFVFPSVLGLLAFSTASMIDGIFIGNFVGATALAAVNLTMPLVAVVFGLLIMISIGGAVVAGKHLGQEQVAEASNIFSKTGIVLVVSLSLVAAITLVWPSQIASLLGARGQTLPISTEYIWVIAWFFPAFGIALLFSQFSRVDGAPGIAFAGIISTTIANILLDYLLVARLGWGVSGAAFATGLSFAIGAFIILFYFLGPNAKLRMVWPTGSWWGMLNTAYNGFSEFLNESSAGIVLLCINWILMSEVGAQGVAAFTIVDYVLYFGILIFFGVSEGLVPLISVNLGGNRPERIYRFLIMAVGFGLIVGLILIAVLLTWSGQLIGLFLTGEEVEIRTLAATIITVIWPMFLFNGANIVISSYFTGMHCPTQSALIAMMRALILPILLIFVLWTNFGVIGAFYALPLAEALTFLLSLFLLRGRWPHQLIVTP